MSRLATLQEAWQRRTPAQKAITSPGYQKLQERFFPLLVLSAADVETEFFLLRDKMDWAYTTAQTYWCALMAAASVFGQAAASWKTVARMLTFLAKEEDPRRPTMPLTYSQFTELVLALGPHNQAVVVAEISFMLGQRVGDVVRLRSNRVSWMPGREFLALQFIEGKTTRRRDPYSLHLPASETATRVFNLAQNRNGFLFNDVDGILQTLRLNLKKLDPQLSVLSLRRGGLQKMAQDGISLSTILHHSRHATEGMPMRYLDWGGCFLNAARELFPNRPPQTASPSI